VSSLSHTLPFVLAILIVLSRPSQFAKAVGATVIATTSSQAKADRVKSLGADHVILYSEDENWGETAKKIAGPRGIQHIIEVGGPNTMNQSLKAIGYDGVISVIGFLGGVKGEKQPSILEALTQICTIRGVYVGSRQQFEEMNRAIVANNIKPVVDSKLFTLDEVKEAYTHMFSQQHFGKVGITCE
jgi:NADPH:quinone reductase-like Zn-dependent oxidoreductase